MHELSVTQSILEIALRHAEKARASRVTALHLVIGQLASYVDDSVQFYWDMVAKDTIAEGAILHFRRIPAEMECLDCGRRYAPDGETLACPQCQGTKVRVNAGKEFYMESIEIDSEDEDAQQSAGG